MAESFTTWLFDQASLQTPVGDLARDAKADGRWPADGDPDQCRAYLAGRGSYAAREALEEAIEEYQF